MDDNEIRAAALQAASRIMAAHITAKISPNGDGRINTDKDTLVLAEVFAQYVRGEVKVTTYQKAPH